MSCEWKAELDRVICEQADDVIGLRRHLNAHPEPSGEELKASLHLYQLLGELGLDVRMGPQGCGVLADSAEDSQLLDTSPYSKRKGAKQRVAFRADIDALRIQDAKDVVYRSTHDGFMHACGHDAHTAIAYGVARALNTLQRQDLLPWTVHWRAIFQPAEETATGARQMMQAGALDVCNIGPACGANTIHGTNRDSVRNDDCSL